MVQAAYPTKRKKPTKQEIRFGRHLKKVRKQQGFTQEKLAGKLDVTAKWVSYIENAHHLPNLRLLFKMAKALGVKVKDLFPF